MARKKICVDDILARLRHVDAQLSEGRTVAEALRAVGLSEATYYRWRIEYGGLARMLR